eukprot:3218975-Pyramimonas_sp.AAC.1
MGGGAARDAEEDPSRAPEGVLEGPCRGPFGPECIFLRPPVGAPHFIRAQACRTARNRRSWCKL